MEVKEEFKEEPIFNFVESLHEELSIKCENNEDDYNSDEFSDLSKFPKASIQDRDSTGNVQFSHEYQEHEISVVPEEFFVQSEVKEEGNGDVTNLVTPCPDDLMKNEAQNPNLEQSEKKSSICFIGNSLSQDGMQTHLEYSVVHSGSPYSCPHNQCTATFEDKKLLKSHVHSVHSSRIRKFGCAHCPKMFKTVSEVKNHWSVHFGERLFYCVHCKSKFNNERALGAHLTKKHSYEKRPYYCAHCPLNFQTETEVKRHLAHHFNNKVCVCVHCPDKKFKRKANLEKHLMIDHS